MTQAPPHIRPARPEERKDVADILADAFAEDPVVKWIYPQPGYAAYSFETTLSAFGPDEGMLIDESKQCACLFIRPGRSFPNVIKAGAIFTGLRRFGIPPLWRSLQFLNSIEKRHYQLPHLYIFAIGCRRSAHGTGLGSAMMKHVIARETPEGVPLYLENSNPKNDVFYRKFGYEEQEVFYPARNGPLMKTMLRV